MPVRQKEIDPRKVAIYIRWSTDDQGEGTTLDVQLDGCKHYLASQGWEFSEELLFIDEGHSGGSMDRPAMRALRQCVAGGRVDCTVVFKLDRLSRSVVDTVQLVLEEWDGLCHVKSAREPIDTASHAGKMFFYMLVSYAEWERAVIRERTFSGKLRRAQEGRNPGFRPPYGYTRDDAGGLFAVIGEEAAVVRRIFELYRHGAGMTAIAHRLNAEGLRFRGGRLFGESTIKKILSNPIYYGDLHYGRRSRNPGRAKRKGAPFYLLQEPVVIRQGAVPAIVSREEWQGVQAARAARPGAAQGTSGRSFSSPHLLTGIARCRCGMALIGYKGGGSRDLYYRCSGQRKKGNQACKCGYIRQDVVNRILLDKFQQEFGDQLARERYAVRARSEAEATLRRCRAGLDADAALHARLEEMQARMRRLFREGELSLPEYREQRADLEREAQDMHRRMEKLSQAIRQTESALAVRLQEEEALERARDIRSLGVEQQKQLLRLFVDSAILYREAGSREVLCEVRWKWGTARLAEAQEVPDGDTGGV